MSHAVQGPPSWMGHAGEFWQNGVHWWREWHITSALLPWEHHEKFSSVAKSCPNLCDPMDGSTPASLSITNSWSLPIPMSIELVVPSNHLILCHSLLLPSIFPSIRVLSNESPLHIRWPKYWSFSFSISPSNEYPGLISFRMDWLDLLAVQRTLMTTWKNHRFG